MCTLCDVEWFTQALLLLPPAAGKVLAVLLNTSMGMTQCHRGALPNGNPVLMTHRSIQELTRDTRLSRCSVQSSLTLLEEKGLIERKARFKQQNQKGTDPHAPAIFVIPMLARDVTDGIKSLKSEGNNGVKAWQREHLALHDLEVQPVAPLNESRGAIFCTPNHGGGDEGSGEVLIKILDSTPPNTTTPPSGDEFRGAKNCTPNKASPVNERGVQPVAPLAEALRAMGFTDPGAFVAQHPAERIEAALAYVSDPMVRLKNPPGFLRTLVEGRRNIPVPPTVDRVNKQRDPDKFIKGRYGHVVKR